MSKVITVNQNGLPCYDICLEQSFSFLEVKLRNLGFAGRRICIVTDSHVAPLYLQQVKNCLSDMASTLIDFIMPAGEKHKNLDAVAQVYEQLILEHFDRKDLLVALGGGVVGDLTGFVAATYLRGIDFIQVPTTLLAQVDSSIGGKTGVDFRCYKNMVGAFKMPRLVYMNIKTLDSLDRRIYLSGMGEIIKHGLIRDCRYLEWIMEHHEDILSRKSDTLEEMIEISCQIKRQVVEEDPTEQGIRAILNMGHTLGHAIERQAGFSLYHGECVAVGCVASGAISLARGLISPADWQKIADAFTSVELPVEAPGLSADEILLDIKNDKKMETGIIKFVLLDQIGHAYIDRTVTQDEMRNALKVVGVR